MENGSGRDAVHGVVNCHELSFICAHSGLFRTLLLCRGSYQKVSSVWHSYITEMLRLVGKRLAVLGPKQRF